MRPCPTLLLLAVLLLAQRSAADETPADCGALETAAATGGSEPLMALARCHEKAGKTATAWAEYERAAALARHEDAPARAEEAAAAAAALAPRLSRIAISIAEPVPGLEIRQDGMLVQPGTPVPVDPGVHRIEASAPERTPWSTEVTVAPDAGAVAVAVPALAPVATPERAAPAPAPAASPGPERGDEGMADRTLAGIVLGALGGAALVVGAALGGVALSKSSDAEERCPGRACGPSVSAADVRDDIRPFADGATAALVLGAATAGFGISLLVVEGICPEQASLVLDGPGASVRGRF